MIRPCIHFFILIFNLALGVPGWCTESDVINEQVQLHELVGKIRAREISKVEILWRNPSAESRSTITPGMLEKLYFRKVIIFNLSASSKSESLAEAVQATSLSTMDPQSEGDVCWAIKFYKTGRWVPIASIYLDGTGKTGVVRGKQYSFNRPLYEWLNSNFFLLPGAGRKKSQRDGIHAH